MELQKRKGKNTAFDVGIPVRGETQPSGKEEESEGRGRQTGTMNNDDWVFIVKVKM